MFFPPFRQIAMHLIIPYSHLAGSITKWVKQLPESRCSAEMYYRLIDTLSPTWVYKHTWNFSEAYFKFEYNYLLCSQRILATNSLFSINTTVVTQIIWVIIVSSFKVIQINHHMTKTSGKIEIVLSFNLASKVTQIIRLEWNSVSACSSRKYSACRK